MAALLRARQPGHLACSLSKPCLHRTFEGCRNNSRIKFYICLFSDIPHFLSFINSMDVCLKADGSMVNLKSLTCVYIPASVRQTTLIVGLVPVKAILVVISKSRRETRTASMRNGVRLQAQLDIGIFDERFLFLSQQLVSHCRTANSQAVLMAGRIYIVMINTHRSKCGKFCLAQVPL